MDHQGKASNYWQRKFIPIGFCWILFLAINVSYNQAPFDASQLTLGNLILFFAPLFFALYLTGALVLRSRRRGLELASLVVTLLVFRLYEVTSPILVLLLLGFVGFLEWYLSRKSVKREA